MTDWLERYAAWRDARKNIREYGLADATDFCAYMWREGMASQAYRETFLNIVVRSNVKANVFA